MKKDALKRARRLKLMLFDVDGVLTDGTLYFSSNGDEIKAFNVLDGHGLKMLAESGVAVGILTSRTSSAVERRAHELGISLVRQGAADKARTLGDMLSERELSPQAAGYMGDDVVDIAVMSRCGFAATVPGAPYIVRRTAHYVAAAQGGHGAAREVCEFIMRAQKTLAAALARYHA